MAGLALTMVFPHTSYRTTKHVGPAVGVHSKSPSGHFSSLSQSRSETELHPRHSLLERNLDLQWICRGPVASRSARRDVTEPAKPAKGHLARALVHGPPRSPIFSDRDAGNTLRIVVRRGAAQDPRAKTRFLYCPGPEEQPASTTLERDAGQATSQVSLPWRLFSCAGGETPEEVDKGPPRCTRALPVRH